MLDQGLEHGEQQDSVVVVAAGVAAGVPISY